MVNTTASALPLLAPAAVITSVPAGTTHRRRRARSDSQNVRSARADRRRERLDADQVEELDVQPLGHLVDAVEHHLAHPREQLDERDAGVGDVVVRPLRAVPRDQALGLVDDVLERAVVEVRRGQAGGIGRSLARAGSRRTGRRGCGGRWSPGPGRRCAIRTSAVVVSSLDGRHLVDVDPRLPLGERVADGLRDQAEQVGVDRLEQQVPDLGSRTAGRITRSPGAVIRTIRIDRSRSSALSVSAIEPVWSTSIGQLKPRPTKLTIVGRGLLGAHRQGLAQLIATVAPLRVSGPLASTPLVASAFTWTCAPCTATCDVALERRCRAALEVELGLRLDGDVVALDRDVAAVADVELRRPGLDRQRLAFGHLDVEPVRAEPDLVRRGADEQQDVLFLGSVAVGELDHVVLARGDPAVVHLPVGRRSSVRWAACCVCCRGRRSRPDAGCRCARTRRVPRP